MDLAALAGTLATLLVGALLSFAPTYLLERRRERHLIRTRWDKELYAAANELVAAARRSQHLADQVAGGENDEDRVRRLDDEHQRLRVAAEHIRILGDKDVQLTARNVVRHSWAYRRLAEGDDDPYADQYEGVTVISRLRMSHLDFYQAVRRQLQVAKPDDVPADLHGQPLPGIPHIERLPID